MCSLWAVPQGSILESLFLIYVNDICDVSKELEFILFADELIKLTSWFQANRFSINIKKTKYMLFKPRQKRQTLGHLRLLQTFAGVFPKKIRTRVVF